MDDIRDQARASLERMIQQVGGIMKNATYNEDFDAILIPARDARIFQSYYRGLSGGKRLKIGDFDDNDDTNAAK